MTDPYVHKGPTEEESIELIQQIYNEYKQHVLGHMPTYDEARVDEVLDDMICLLQEKAND